MKRVKKRSSAFSLPAPGLHMCGNRICLEGETACKPERRSRPLVLWHPDTTLLSHHGVGRSDWNEGFCAGANGSASTPGNGALMIFFTRY